MLVSSQLENHTNKVTIGTKEKFYERYFENAIDKLDFKQHMVIMLDV